MNEHSIFIIKNKEISEEWHALTWTEAMELALIALYTFGKLNPKIEVMIRNPETVCFTATNP